LQTSEQKEKAGRVVGDGEVWFWVSPAKDFGALWVITVERKGWQLLFLPLG